MVELWYLTESIDLAKEWAFCRPNETNSYVHQYELDTEGLEILDFQEKGVLAWFVELMKNRDAADSKRYRMLAKKFIAKYGVDTNKYDVIRGWRANASYFYITKEFVIYNLDMDILEELLSLGGFMPDWIGEFYTYYQWYYDIPSSEVLKKVPLDFIKRSILWFARLGTWFGSAKKLVKCNEYYLFSQS